MNGYARHGLLLVLCMGAATLAAESSATAAESITLNHLTVTPHGKEGHSTDRTPEAFEHALHEYDTLVANRGTIEQELRQLYLSPEASQAASHKLPARIQTQIKKFEQQLQTLDRQIADAAVRVDEAGGQRTCSVSRLYWHTDIDQARIAAAETNRPILSLRMLGKLTDEYSCANSRFFRTALYSNKKVGDFLRTNFVLHWQSVRPVPRVTIDFGDGRKLERTLTGNSAHIVLAADGTPLDVLPGLYSPLAFLRWISLIRDFHAKYHYAAADKRPAMLTAFHQRQRDRAVQQWDYDLQQIGIEKAEQARLRINMALAAARLAGEVTPKEIAAPKANKAFEQAVVKTVAEAPVLRFARLGGTWMERGMNEELWQALANLHRSDVQLDEASVAVMRREAPTAEAAAGVAVTKSIAEDPILRVVKSFEDSIALDTVRNEYLLHRRVHEAFSTDMAAVQNSETLNEWVYAELFLTPSSDPWLGLVPRDVYSALEDDGKTQPEATREGQAATRRSPFLEGGR